MAKQQLRGAQIASTPARYLDRSGNLSAPKEVITLYGWGFGNSTGGSISVTMNFGMTFKSPPVVIAQTLGYKTGSDPTSISDTGGTAGEIARGGMETTTTSTKVFITGVGGGAITSGVRILFNLIVIGEPA